MDDMLRAELQAKLSNAMKRQARIGQQLQEHSDTIERIRDTLGNPYFFHPRPPDHPESKSRYTGYASHDPGLQLIRDWQDVQHEITEILTRLDALA